MNSLDGLLESKLLEPENILQLVDEYALYCHYLGQQVELGKRMLSPIRPHNNLDDCPSFSVFYSRWPDREFSWKDQATGQKGEIFSMLKQMWENQGLPISGYNDVYRKVDADFALGINTPGIINNVEIPHYGPPPPQMKIKISIKSKEFIDTDINYWKQFGPNRELLERYKTKSVQRYWLTPNQQYGIVPKGLCYSYEVYSKHKLYQPHEEKDKKFRNDFTDLCVEGFEQLEYNQDTLIITKATKDIMCLRSMGYEAVSPRSENTPMDERFLRLFERKYSNIFVLFDNDGKHKAEWYPYPLLQIPLPTGSKDPSDHHRDYGPDATKRLMYNLVNEALKCNYQKK
jgi:hypothetical protein